MGRHVIPANLRTNQRRCSLLYLKNVEALVALVLKFHFRPKFSLRFTLQVAFFNIVASIRTTLTFGDRQFKLGQSAVVEKQFKWNERQTFFLDPSFQFANLLPVQQKFARSCGTQIFVMRIGVGRHVHLVEKHFSLFNARETILKVCFTLADGFYFRAAQHDARFESVEDNVGMAGAAIGNDRGRLFLTIFFHRGLGDCIIIMDWAGLEPAIR